MVMPTPEPDDHQTPSPRLPWEFHPALTEQRLRLCARLLANARRDAVALAAYEMAMTVGRSDAVRMRSASKD